MILWDAQMPKFDNMKYFPHIIYWTPIGLIKKILIQQKKPLLSFWLAQNQYSLAQDDSLLDVWDGEVDDVDVNSESTIEDNNNNDATNEDDDIAMFEKKETAAIEKTFIDDVRDLDGVRLVVIALNDNGDQMEAKDYLPGNELIFSVQVLLVSVFCYFKFIKFSIIYYLLLKILILVC
jgi:hypothetical protein